MREVRRWVGPLFHCTNNPALGSVLEHVRASQESLLIIYIGMLHEGEGHVFTFSLDFLQ